MILGYEANIGLINYRPKWSWAEMVMGRNGHGPKWLWAEMTQNPFFVCFFVFVFCLFFLDDNHLQPAFSSRWRQPAVTSHFFFFFFFSFFFFVHAHKSSIQAY